MRGSENWVLNGHERKAIETARMHFLRSASGYTLRDHIHNTKTRSALHVHAVEEGLQTKSSGKNKSPYT
jgi:hypothetical protein